MKTSYFFYYTVVSFFRNPKPGDLSLKQVKGEFVLALQWHAASMMLVIMQAA